MKRQSRRLAVWAALGAAWWLAGAAGTLLAAELEEGFVSIFNGTNMIGWLGNPVFWSARDGVLTGRTTEQTPAPANLFLIWRGADVVDFELRLQYRLTPMNANGFANSGVQYRSRVLSAANQSVGGYQADLEAGPTFSGILYDEAGIAGGRGVMANRGEKVVWDRAGNKQVVGTLGTGEALQQAIKQSEWNDYTITVRGWHFVHQINGVTMVDVTDHAVDQRLAAGAIALQLHAGEPMMAQFRNIRLKRFPAEKKIVLIAGAPSHGPGEHEHRAGCLLLQKCLAQVPGMSNGGD